MCMMMDVNYTYCGGHFEIYTNIESLSCVSEINVIFQFLKY